MQEPEVLLRQLGEEEPPGEIALAAVRVFRYRAIAVLAVLTVVAVVVVPRLVQVVSHTPPEAVGAALAASEDLAFVQVAYHEHGMNILLWEFVCEPTPRLPVRTPDCYLHAMAWHDDPAWWVLLGALPGQGGSTPTAVQLRRSTGQVVELETSDGQRGAWIARDSQHNPFGEDRWIRIPQVEGNLDGELLLHWIAGGPEGAELEGTFVFRLPFSSVEEVS